MEISGQFSLAQKAEVICKKQVIKLRGVYYNVTTAFRKAILLEENRAMVA